MIGRNLRVLFTWLPLKSQMRLNNEFYTSFLEPISKFMELIHGQCQSSVGDRHLVAINRVEVVNASVVVSNPMSYNLMAMQTKNWDGITKFGKPNATNTQFGIEQNIPVILPLF
jgi:hypothetical protein